jgi:DNA-binding MarR family transcriptional regulator
MTARHPEPALSVGRENPVSWAVMTLAHTQRGLAAARLAPLGLFPGQEVMLLQLWDRDGRSQKELGDLLNLDHSTVAKSVQRLERAGLVHRSRSAADGRVTLVHLTDAARALEAPVRAVWSDLEARLASRLTPEQVQQLTVITGRMLAAEAPDQPAV